MVRGGGITGYIRYPTERKKSYQVQLIAFEMLFSLNLQFQSRWSLLNGTWLKRPIQLDHRFRFENQEMTLQIQ